MSHTIALINCGSEQKCAVHDDAFIKRQQTIPTTQMPTHSPTQQIDATSTFFLESISENVIDPCYASARLPLLISGCAAKDITDEPANDRVASAELASISKPELKPRIGVVQVNKLTGKERSYTALGIDDNGIINGQSSSGRQ